RGDAEVARVLALGLRPLVELVAAVRIVAGQQVTAAGDQRIKPLQALERLRVAGLGALAGPGVVVDVFEIRALHLALETGGQRFERRGAVVAARGRVDQQWGTVAAAIAYATVQGALHEPVAQARFAR